MKNIFALVLLAGLACPAFAQDIETTCETTFGVTHCTSHTVDNRTQGERNAQALADGFNNQQARDAGAAIANRVRVHNYCKLHSGDAWTLTNPNGIVIASGVCK